MTSRSNPMPSSSPKEIIYVDPNEVYSEIISTQLEKSGEYVVKHFTRTDVALEYIGTHHPVLLITRTMVPPYGGLDLIKRIKADSKIGIRIIIMSVKGAEADVEKGFAVGADAYITLPFDPTELSDFIDRVLKSKPGEKSSDPKNP